MNVLIVEDSPIIRLMITGMLEELGHKIVGETDNHDDAVKEYRALKPDLVTLDLGLSDVEGQTVLESIMKLDKQAKVLVITGRDQPKIKDRLMQWGAAGYVTKPFTLEELRDALAGIFAK